MAYKSAVNAALYLAGYDLTGHSNKVDWSGGREYEDVTTFGNTGHKHHPLLFADTATIESFYDDTADTGTWAAFNAKRTHTTAIITSILQEGDTLAAPAIFGESWLEDAATSLALGSVTKLTWGLKFEEQSHTGAQESALSPTGIQDGFILYPKTTVTTDTAGTASDNSASTANGAVAAVHIFALTASDQVEVIIQESTTNAWGGEETTVFTTGTINAASVPYSVLLAATGTIDRYIRAYIDVTDAGGGGVSTTVAVQMSRL